MPGQFAGVRVPVEDVKDGRVGRFFHQLIAAVLLRDLKGLIGIYFQVRDVPGLGGEVGGVVIVFAAGVNAASGSVRGIGAGPDEGLDGAGGDRGEGAAPDGGFAVRAFGIRVELRLQSDGLVVVLPATRRDVSFL